MAVIIHRLIGGIVYFLLRSEREGGREGETGRQRERERERVRERWESGGTGEPSWQLPIPGTVGQFHGVRLIVKTFTCHLSSPQPTLTRRRGCRGTDRWLMESQWNTTVSGNGGLTLIRHRSREELLYCGLVLARGPVWPSGKAMFGW